MQQRFVCKLRNSLYGLRQSPRQWYKKFDSFKVSQNFTRSEYDHCVYFKKLENDMFIILVLYVDDRLIIGNIMVKINRLKAQLVRTFNMNNLGANKLILCMEIHINGKMVSCGYHKRIIRRNYFKDLVWIKCVGFGS